MSDPDTEGYWHRITENPPSISNAHFMPPTFKELNPGNLIKVELDEPDDLSYMFDYFNVPTLYKSLREGLRTETTGPAFHIRKGTVWTGIVLKREILPHTHAISAANMAIALRKSNYYMIEALISDGSDVTGVHLVRINSINATCNGLRISQWVYAKKSTGVNSGNLT